jgi:hypothetical protein
MLPDENIAARDNTRAYDFASSSPEHHRGLLSNSGSLAMLLAMLLASSRISASFTAAGTAGAAK